MKTIQALAVVALLSAIWGISSPAHASIGLSIQPVKVSYTLNPGQSVTDSVLVTNAGSDAVVYPSVLDFVPVAGTSNISFVGSTQGVTSVADWVSVDSPKSFDFKPGDSKTISFTVSVPKDAEPGSHFGGIFFRAIDANAASSSLKIGTQVGMLVLVTVPGSHLEKGKIDGFSTAGFIQGGPVDFDIKFENTGTVFFEPKGDIKVKNIFGRTVADIAVQGDVVLPTGERDIAISWPSGFLLGPYTASLVLYDGEGNQLTADAVSFFALPVWYIVGLLVALIVIYGIIVFLKRRVSFSIAIKK